MAESCREIERLIYRGTHALLLYFLLSLPLTIICFMGVLFFHIYWHTWTQSDRCRKTRAHKEEICTCRSSLATTNCTLFDSHLESHTERDRDTHETITQTNTETETHTTRIHGYTQYFYLRLTLPSSSLFLSSL